MLFHLHLEILKMTFLHSPSIKTIGYSPPLTNLAAQTEFSQPQKDCSGSSKDGHGL